MLTARPCHHKIEPEHLGPLGDRSLAESAKARNPDDLFDGASTFLSARHQRRRREQWNAAMPLAERVLKPEEHVLYVAHGMQMPQEIAQIRRVFIPVAKHETREIHLRLLDRHGG